MRLDLSFRSVSDRLIEFRNLVNLYIEIGWNFDGIELNI